MTDADKKLLNFKKEWFTRNRKQHRLFFYDDNY